MGLTPKQEQRIEGIIAYVNGFLDRRFGQMGRISPLVANVEPDLRWHLIENLRGVLGGAKAFGPVKLIVGDILCSSDESKKRDLLLPSQVCIMNEIVSVEEENVGKTDEQLEFTNLKMFLKAIDPSLEKIVLLTQAWVWWDLRDSADLYRFDLQTQHLQTLHSREMDAVLTEHYRKEMQLGEKDDVTKEQVIAFECRRLQDLLKLYQQRRAHEKPFQVVPAQQTLQVPPEADAACIRLAKRLALLEKLRATTDGLDDNTRQFYAGPLGIDAGEVTLDKVTAFEEEMIHRERQALSRLLLGARTTGTAGNYKMVLLIEMHHKAQALFQSLGIHDHPESNAARVDPNAPKPEA